MTVVYHQCEQGTEEWHRCRLGIPTASMFATVMAKGRDGGASVTRREYLLKLVGEIMTGEISESYSNEHMQRGKDMEAEARETYAIMTDAEPTRVGFVRNGPKGCSPDSLLNTNGLLEIKTKLPHRLLDVMLKGDFPVEHKAQCQGALWVAEREWIDIAVYWPKMPLFTKRAYRDEDYIKKMSAAVDAFNDELACTLEQARRYQPAAEAA